MATAGSVLGQQFEAFRILPPDTASPNGFFAQRVAVDLPWAAIADRPESDVFIYKLTPTGWRLTQCILEGPGNLFGESMAFDGHTLVIGSPTWDYTGERKGKVFVYERDGMVWRRAQDLQPPGLRWDDRFGAAVAIDGDVLVAGAFRVATPNHDGGAVFIYERSASLWHLTSVFRYDPLAVGHHALLGRTVAVSGWTVVAGAPGTLAGEVRVFERDSTGWRHTAVLTDPTPTNADGLGKSVAIHGDTVVAGEGGQPTSGFGYKQGSALIFERGAGGGWQLVQEIEASDGYGNGSGSDYFGSGVSIEGDKIAVAAPGSHAAGVGASQGAVYMYQQDGSGSWPLHETGVYVPSDPSVHLSAENVDLRGNVVIIGSTSPRRAYVFEVESGTSFCQPAPNSSGKPGHLAAVFSPEGGGFLSAHDVPDSTLGVFLVSLARDEIAFQPSPLCLGAEIWRLQPVAPTGNAGVSILELDLGPYSGLVSGVTVFFQYWFEDASASVGTFNFTNGVATVIP